MYVHAILIFHLEGSYENRALFLWGIDWAKLLQSEAKKCYASLFHMVQRA